MNGAAIVNNESIQNLNYRHEAILVWMLENPHRKLRDCAQELNYTMPWISRIVHSDLFQAEYKKRCRERGDIAVHSTAARLGALGSMAIDKLTERLEATGEEAPSDQTLVSVMNSTLDKLGFTPETRKGGGLYVENMNVLAVSREDLAQARDRALLAGLPLQVQEAPQEVEVRHE